jgi:hypothetical protein
VRVRLPLPAAPQPPPAAMDVHQRRLQHNRGAARGAACRRDGLLLLLLLTLWAVGWMSLTRFFKVAGYSTSFDVSATGRGSFEFITVRADA